MGKAKMKNPTPPVPAPSAEPDDGDAGEISEAVDILLRLVGPLVRDDVDLTVFGKGEVEYLVLDIAGTEKTYVLPKDMPFAEVTAFLRAYDGWDVAVGSVARAQAVAEEAAARAQSSFANPKGRARAERDFQGRRDDLLQAQDGLGAAWAALLDGFLPLVRIRQPEENVAGLSRIGANQMEHWVKAVVVRLQRGRLDALGGLKQLLETLARGGPKGPGNRAARRTKRRK